MYRSLPLRTETIKRWTNRPAPIALTCNKIEDRLEPKHGTIRSSPFPWVDVVKILPEVALGDVSGILCDVALFSSITITNVRMRELSDRL